MKLIMENWKQFLTNVDMKSKSKYISIHELRHAIEKALHILGMPRNEKLARFLLEIATVESGLSLKGKSQITHFPRYNSFQLDPSALKRTQRKSNWKIVTLRDRIDNMFGQKQYWEGKSLKEVRSNPLFGALCAAMYIVDKAQPRTGPRDPRGRTTDYKNIPPSLKDRARIWKRRYNTLSGDGTVKKYKDKNKLPKVITDPDENAANMAMKTLQSREMQNLTPEDIKKSK